MSGGVVGKKACVCRHSGGSARTQRTHTTAGQNVRKLQMQQSMPCKCFAASSGTKWRTPRNPLIGEETPSQGMLNPPKRHVGWRGAGKQNGNLARNGNLNAGSGKAWQELLPKGKAGMAVQESRHGNGGRRSGAAKACVRMQVKGVGSLQERVAGVCKLSFFRGGVGPVWAACLQSERKERHTEKTEKSTGGRPPCWAGHTHIIHSTTSTSQDLLSSSCNNHRPPWGENGR